MSDARISNPHQSPPRVPDELDLRAMVFHVRPEEARLLERALRKFGGPRRRRGAALAAAIRRLRS